jgi:uncharacterized protein YlaI
MTDTKHKLPKPVCGVCGKPVHVEEDGTATDATANRSLLTKQIRGYTCKECEDRAKDRTRKLVEEYISGKTSLE